MKTLYFDIISGISGDMTLSALIQFGIDLEQLNHHLSELLNGTVELSLADDKINGISVKQLKISSEGCSAPHRNFTAISEMLKNATLPKNVITNAIAIFDRIAIAEAAVHQQPIDSVHFHEVGAIDSIIDIVGAAYAIDQISPDQIISSPVIIGNGMVKTEHGMLPVPAPATTALLNNIPIKRIDIDSELTTPTGAAIISHYATAFSKSIEGQIKDTHYSCGSKRFEHHPNMLRVLDIETDEAVPQEVEIIETHLDDDTGENLGFVLNLLMKSGALDASYTPIFMKKNRPAVKLTVICKASDREKLTVLILKNTTAAGVRYYSMKRTVMNRHIHTISFKGHDIRIKTLSYGDILKSTPEWEDIARVSKSLEISPSELYKQIPI